MSRRNNGYTTVRQARLNARKSGGTHGGGKRTVYFTIGGRGTKHDQGERCGYTEFWNPRKGRPSKRYVDRRKIN
jgi:hypothetical protein